MSMLQSCCVYLLKVSEHLFKTESFKKQYLKIWWFIILLANHRGEQEKYFYENQKLSVRLSLLSES